MTNQRNTGTLAVLGLLAGFVNVDAFGLIPAAPGAVKSSLGREQTSSRVMNRESSNRGTWLSMSSSVSAVGNDIPATREDLDDKPSRASVMDELDAILGDVKLVSRRGSSRTSVSQCFVPGAWTSVLGRFIVFLALAPQHDRRSVVCGRQVDVAARVGAPHRSHIYQAACLH